LPRPAPQRSPKSSSPTSARWWTNPPAHCNSASKFSAP